MPTTAIHPGAVAANILIPQFDLGAGIKISKSGVSLADASDSIDPGLRDDLQITWTAEIKAVENEYEKVHGMTVKIVCTTEATRFDTNISNYRKLAQNRVQSRLLDVDGLYYTFKKNTGGQTTPNGTTELSFNYEVVVTETDRYAQITLEGFMTMPEFEYFCNNTATNNGITGGTTLGLTAQSYTMDDFRCAKIDTITVTNSAGAAPIGDFFGYQFKASTVPTDPDQRGLRIPMYELYELTGKGRQTRPVEDLLAYRTDTNKDVTIAVAFMAGDAFTSTSAMSFIPKVIDRGSKASHVEFSGKGRIPLRSAYCTFGVGTWAITRTV